MAEAVADAMVDALADAAPDAAPDAVAEGAFPDRHDLVTFGEALARLSVPRGERLMDATRFEVHVGGAEANVAAVLAQLGRRARWLSTLPEGDLGELVVRRLRAFGVDVGGVARMPGARLGAYYFEPGVPPRPGRVFYDRADSALRRGGIDPSWMDDVAGARAFHVTGVTAALGEQVAGQVRTLVEAARAHGTAVTFDVNYRSALWTEAEARGPSRWLAERATIVFCSLRDGPILIGDEAGDEAGDDAARDAGRDAGGPERGEAGADAPAAAVARGERLARAIVGMGPEVAIVSIGEEGVVACGEGETFVTPAVPVEVVDRVGAGDALAAGVIDGWLDGDVEAGVRRGQRLAALALAQPGDMLLLSPGDVGEEGAVRPGGGGIVR